MVCNTVQRIEMYRSDLTTSEVSKKQVPTYNMHKLTRSYWETYQSRSLDEAFTQLKQMRAQQVLKFLQFDRLLSMEWC